MSVACQLLGLLTHVSTGICSGTVTCSCFFLTKNWALVLLTLLFLRFKYIFVSIDQYRFPFSGFYSSKLRFSKRLKLNSTGCKFILVTLYKSTVVITRRRRRKKQVRQMICETPVPLGPRNSKDLNV